jgi:hypothetical protein
MVLPVQDQWLVIAAVVALVVIVGWLVRVQRR